VRHDINEGVKGKRRENFFFIPIVFGKGPMEDVWF
jgi:hypothetical protein